MTALADRIDNLANRMHQLTFDRTENNAALIQIHSCAVTLWNIAVAMKTGGQTGTTYNAKCKNVVVHAFPFFNNKISMALIKNDSTPETVSS